MTEHGGMQDGTVYRATDGQWYRWPDSTPYSSEAEVPASGAVTAPLLSATTILPTASVAAVRGGRTSAGLAALIGGVAIALVVGFAAGAVARPKTVTKIKTETRTETVTQNIDVPYVPQECLDALTGANKSIVAFNSVDGLRRDFILAAANRYIPPGLNGELDTAIDKMNAEMGRYLERRDACWALVPPS